MRRMTTAELREKEIINLTNGECLGFADDFEFDICDGKMTALIILGDKGFFGNKKTEDLFIPINKVECFGEDTVLVRLSLTECCRSEFKKKKKSNFAG